MKSVIVPLDQATSPPARSAGGEGGARAKRGRVRWATVSASHSARLCSTPPHLPIASQWVPSSPPRCAAERTLTLKPQHLAGVHDVLGVERALDGAHGVELDPRAIVRE